MSSALSLAVLEIERHVAAGGWDQPPRLYALARTADLLRNEPALAEQFGGTGGMTPTGHVGEPGPEDEGDPALTPIEQEPLPADRPLDELLAAIVWPVQVAGCALVVERLTLPPSAESDVPEGGEVAEWAAAHPDRREVRMAVGVLRDGSRECAVRLRRAEGTAAGDDDVLTGPDLVPGLADALQATLQD